MDDTRREVPAGSETCGGPSIPGRVGREISRTGRVAVRHRRGVSVVGERELAGIVVRALKLDAMAVVERGGPEQVASRALWFVQQGAGIIYAERGARFDAGDTIVLPPDEPVTIAATAAGEVLEVVLGGQGRWWPPSVDVSRPTSSSVVAVALSAAVLKPMPRPTDGEVHQLSTVLEVLAQATAASAAPEAARVNPLARRADAVIAENAHDPDFSVERLARMLSVSRRHLTRVLSQAGRTPADRIRDVRLSRVQAAWDAHGDELLRDDLLARWFGFRSSRALRESLSRAATVNARG